MKHITIIFLLIIASLSGCDDPKVAKGTPDCILERIEQLKAAPVSNPPMEIWRYQYQGRTVYYLPPQCCDIPSVLLDENCNRICSPDGGFGGSGDGKCSDFSKTRTDGELIWKDDRTK